MSQNKKLGFWSSRQTVAILAIIDIKPSRFTYDFLLWLDAGSLTYEDAKAEILKRATAKSLNLGSV